MAYKTFKDFEPTIIFEYPSRWKLLKESNQTYLFYDEMLGSFRFTHLQVSKDVNLDSHLNNKCLEKAELNPEWVMQKELRFLYYKEVENKREGDTIIHYFWAHKENILLLFSYAYNTFLENSEEINTELKEVNRVLSTIK